MNSTITREGYTIAQKVVHWLMALLLLMDLTVAQQFGGELQNAVRLENREGHVVVGTIILILLIIRIYLRRKHGAPALPASVPSWQRIAATATHHGFYVLLTVVVATGVFTALNATTAINWLGIFDIALLGNTSEEQFQSVRIFHELATKALIALIVVHIVAAIYHLFLKDGITTSMLKFWKRQIPRPRSVACHVTRGIGRDMTPWWTVREVR